MKKTSVSSTRQRTPFDQVPPNAPSVVVGLKKGAIFFTAPLLDAKLS